MRTRVFKMLQFHVQLNTYIYNTPTAEFCFIYEMIVNVI